MKRITIFALIFALLSLIAVPFAFAGKAGQKAIETFFNNTDTEMETLFAPSFLKAVPKAEIIKVRDEYIGKLGKLKKVLPGDKKYDLTFEKGTTVSKVSLDKDGRMVGFWLGPIQPLNETWENVLSDIKALGGTASVVVMKNGTETLREFNAEQPLAVGSAFKLYILKALVQKMEAERLSWAQTVALDEKYKSLPSGLLQEWPTGSELTLDTLANLMISVSDNTATDHLLHFVGRPTVEAVAPDRVRPFYSTAEMFRIKGGLSEKEQKQFLKATSDEKRVQIEKINKIELGAIDFPTTPTLIEEVEWLLTTKELCTVILELKDRKAITINPGIVDKSDWAYVGYKGGSEPGVLNQTYLLQAKKGGPWYTVSLTVNDKEKLVDLGDFNTVLARLLTLLKDGKLD